MSTRLRGRIRALKTWKRDENTLNILLNCGTVLFCLSWIYLYIGKFKFRSFYFYIWHRVTVIESSLYLYFLTEMRWVKMKGNLSRHEIIIIQEFLKIIWIFDCFYYVSARAVLDIKKVIFFHNFMASCEYEMTLYYSGFIWLAYVWPLGFLREYFIQKYS